MVTTDNSPTSPFLGSVYVGYDEANVNNAAHVLYSRNGFGSWTKSSKINDTGATIGVNAAVAPDGTVYAGTDKTGRIYRIDSHGKGFVLHQAMQSEVRTLLLDDGATV